MKTKEGSDTLKEMKILFDSNTDSKDFNFSSICKFIRQTLGVTQAEMAQKLGINPDTYRFWENGRNEPTSKSAFNLCLMYLQAIQIQQMNADLRKSELFPLFSILNIFEEKSTSNTKRDVAS